MKQKLIIVMMGMALTSCGEQTVGANAGRVMLGVSTLGVSELIIERNKERRAAADAKCAQFQGMDNIKCLNMLNPPPQTTQSSSPEVVINHPIVQDSPMPMPTHCTTMNMGGGMASTNCM